MTTRTDGGKPLELKVVGKRPNHRPYLRIADTYGDYIASIDDARRLRGLANQILRALDGKPGSHIRKLPK